jgi:xanthine dehydrogenase accessory factor
MDTLEWLDQAQRMRQRREPFAVVTVLRVVPPTSVRPGDKAVVAADGTIHGWIGGGCAQPAVLKTVRAALKDGEPRQIRVLPSVVSDSSGPSSDVQEFGMTCHSGGTVELFVEPCLPRDTLLVIGDSPVARALTALATRVGFEVALVALGARSEDYPDAHWVGGDDSPDAVRAQVPPRSFVVVATQGRRDVSGLKAGLATQPARLWFVASARKASVLRKQLIDEGIAADLVAGIEAPAGERIGAKTPEEIALAVLASVVAARRQVSSAPTAVVRAEAS